MGYKMLDLCCGRLGWAKAFLARGWECTGVDLVAPPEIPPGFTFRCMNILDWTAADVAQFDFVCASTPCEQFSLWGMRHFHPNPPYPKLGIELFNHVRSIFEASGIPFVMENVRAAEQFVGAATNHCGSFYLWGNAVPPLLNQGIKKGLDMGWDKTTGKRTLHLGRRSSHNSKARAADKSITATIPPELAGCVADYAQRLVFDFGEVRPK